MEEKDVKIQNKDDLTNNLAELERITKLLQRYGFWALSFTILNFATLILSLSIRFLPLNLAAQIFLAIHLPIVLTLTAIISLIRYESLRKRGDTLFEEISDELAWYVRPKELSKESSKNPHPQERPLLNTRIILRSFARAADLPLIPGKFGPGLYTTINFLMLFFGIYFFRVVTFIK